ncbi:MAG: glycosyltransferase, partial [Sediminispirochaetaceae bacterium]
MNIGIFSDCYLPTPNGVSRSVHHLKEGLEARGHRVVLVTAAGFQGARRGELGEQRGEQLGGPRGECFPRSDRLDESRKNPGRPDEPRIYSVPSFPFSRSLRLHIGLTTAAAMRRIIGQEGIEIIHTHTEFSIGRAARRAGLDLGIPMVHTFHTMYEDYRHHLPLGRLI